MSAPYRIETALTNGLSAGGAGMTLGLVRAGEVFQRGGDELTPVLLTNGGPMPIDITLACREDESSERVTPFQACEALGCTPAALRHAIEHAYPEAAAWDWGFGSEAAS